MARVVAETLKKKIDFAADSWKTLELPEYTGITQIDLLVHLNVSTGTSGGTPAADAPFNILKNIQIVKGGKYPIQATGWLLYVKNYYEYHDKIQADSLPTAASTTKDVYFELVIHPGFYPEKRDDLSIGIDASGETTYLQVLWGAASDLGSGYTINSGDITVTLWHVPGARPRFVPAWSISKKSIDQSYSDLGLYIDLPSQKMIHKAILDIRDTRGDRSDSVVTEIGIVKTVPQKTELLRLSYDAEKNDDRRRYQVVPLTGEVIVDAEEIGYLEILGVDDIKLALSTASEGNLTVLWVAR